MTGPWRTTTAHSSCLPRACPSRLSCRGHRNIRGPGRSLSSHFARAHSLPDTSPHTCSTPAQPSRTPAPPQPQQPNTTPAPSWSRRSALLGVPLLSGALLPGGWGCGALAAVAGPAGGRLRSLGWAVPCELTVLNDLEGPLKVYWLNYDGDPELFGSLTPGSVFTVQTFESHAWRFVDGHSGATVAEHVAAAGPQVVRVVAPRAAAAVAAGASSAPAGGATTGPGGPGRLAGPDTASYTYTAGPADGTQPPQTAVGSRGGGGGGGAAAEGVASAPPGPGAQRPGLEAEAEGGGLGGPRRGVVRGNGAGAPAAFEGFDGLGNEEQQYSLAQLREIRIYPGGGNVLLALPGVSQPLEVALAGPEALTLVAATGSLEQRRPSTLGTWTRSLVASGADVRRVCITRVVDGIYYCRIVLSRPDSSLASLDATPGDSLSLALQLGRPIYVANDVARIHQSVMEVFSRRRQAMEAAAASGVLDEEAEAAADREAQDALDCITRGLPAAPRPVRVLEMEEELDA